MKSYQLTVLAQQDLAEILGYIAQDSLQRAMQWQENLEEAMSTLADYPTMGRARPDLTDQPVKFWPVGNYFIVYRFNHGLEVLRVLNSYCNLNMVLR